MHVRTPSRFPLCHLTTAAPVHAPFLHPLVRQQLAAPQPTLLTKRFTRCFHPRNPRLLAGESANGSFPDVAVSTMARIARSAEIGVNFYQSFDYIRTFTPKPVGPVEAICSAVAKNAVDIRPGA